MKKIFLKVSEVFSDLLTLIFSSSNTNGMARITILLVLSFYGYSSFSQEIVVQPEVLFGNRSVMFQSQFKAQFTKSLSFNNYFLIDNQYDREKNQIYFFRNMLSYHHSKCWQSNIAVGLKNPGLFSTVSWTYKKREGVKSLIYSIGITLQKTLSLEQSVLFKQDLIEFKNYVFRFQFLVIASFDVEGYLRGLQQIRFGIQKGSIQTGFGINLDQFNNATKALYNYGAYFKFNFNKTTPYGKEK